MLSDLIVGFVRVLSRPGPLVLALAIGSVARAEPVPLGLPQLPYSAAAPAMRKLGEKIFFDTRLSRDGKISCASCHQPEHAFTDGLPQARGSNGLTATRNTPSLLNVRFNQTLFWDGRRERLEEQAFDPLTNPREHGLDNATAVVARIANEPSYRAEFAKVFNGTQSITQENIGIALAAFQRNLLTAASAFDRLYYANDKSALSPAAQRGLQLFTGKANCASCHLIGEKGALFTDEKFHSLGVGLGKINAKLAQLTQRVVEIRKNNAPLDHAVINDMELAELGRFVVTLNPQDIGAFRTPSLRNVALTAPYMHDGSVTTLAEAIDLELYYRGARDGEPLILSLTERADLLEFLRALTSPNLQKQSISGSLFTFGLSSVEAILIRMECFD